MRIVLDPGHSGRECEPGAVGQQGLLECDVTLKVCKLVAEMLKSHEVVLTREGDIDDDDLSWRAEIANKADVFVSVHCNAAEAKSAYGSEVWIANNASHATKVLASIMCKELKKVTGRDRGVKVQDFTVINNAVPPAVLVELDFISNMDVEDHFKDDPTAYANAVATAIEKWAAM